MLYRSKAEVERAKWATLLELIVRACTADYEPAEAQRQIRNALADGVLRPLRWEDEKPGPSGPTGGLTFPDDKPPLDRRYWIEAEIDWAAGTVLDVSEFSYPPRHRRLLIHRVALAEHWPQPTSLVAPPSPGTTDAARRDRREHDPQAVEPPTQSDHGAEPVYTTGLPGRPTSWHLIEREFRTRYAAGEQHPTNTEWARVLIAWLKSEHPLAPVPTDKTVTGRLGGLSRELKVSRPKS